MPILKDCLTMDKGTPEGLKIALQYFDLALEIDPNNALAHVGIADVWIFRYQVGMVQRQEAMPLITTPLEKALELDNTLADAHVEFGCSQMFYRMGLGGRRERVSASLKA